MGPYRECVQDAYAALKAWLSDHKLPAIGVGLWGGAWALWEAFSDAYPAVALTRVVTEVPVSLVIVAVVASLALAEMEGGAARLYRERESDLVALLEDCASLRSALWRDDGNLTWAGWRERLFAWVDATGDVIGKQYGEKAKALFKAEPQPAAADVGVEGHPQSRRFRNDLILGLDVYRERLRQLLQSSK